MDLRDEMLLRKSTRKFESREDMAYFIGKAVRNWNMIMMVVTLIGWLFVVYGMYYRIDQHITDSTIHVTPAEAVLLDDLQSVEFHNRLTVIEIKLNTIEHKLDAHLLEVEPLLQHSKTVVGTVVIPTVTVTPTVISP